MKLEVGMYVRTKNGNIGKITFISSLDNLMNLDTENYSIGKHFVEKASHNIIDLIEVGDYVNGEKVILVNKGYIEVGTTSDYIGFTNEENIKSILTREQFSAMEYKID